MQMIQVWNDNCTTLKQIINKIRYQYNLEHTFVKDAENIFFLKFDKYYEDDKQYFRFFYTCLCNKAKNIYRERVVHQKLISVCESVDGTEIDIYDIIPQTNIPEVESEIFIAEINNVMKSTLDEFEYFIFEHLLEGWKIRDICKMLDIKRIEFEEIHDVVKQEVRKFYDKECYPRKIPVC